MLAVAKLASALPVGGIKVAEPRVVAPSRNATVPVGTVPPGGPETTAVNVSAWPRFRSVSSGMTWVWVGICPDGSTVSVAIPEVLLTSPESPEYTAATA